MLFSWLAWKPCRLSGAGVVPAAGVEPESFLKRHTRSKAHCFRLRPTRRVPTPLPISNLKSQISTPQPLPACGLGCLSGPHRRGGGGDLVGLTSVLPTNVTPSSTANLAALMSPNSSVLALISILSLAMTLPLILPLRTTEPTFSCRSRRRCRPGSRCRPCGCRLRVCLQKSIHRRISGCL